MEGDREGGRGDEVKGERGGGCWQVAMPYCRWCPAGAHVRVSTGGWQSSDLVLWCPAAQCASMCVWGESVCLPGTRHLSASAHTCGGVCTCVCVKEQHSEKVYGCESVWQRQHVCLCVCKCECVCDSLACPCSQCITEWALAVCFTRSLSLFLPLSHTHTHTHTLSPSFSQVYFPKPSPLLFFLPPPLSHSNPSINVCGLKSPPPQSPLFSSSPPAAPGKADLGRVGAGVMPQPPSLPPHPTPPSLKWCCLKETNWARLSVLFLQQRQGRTDAVTQSESVRTLRHCRHISPASVNRAASHTHFYIHSTCSTQSSLAEKEAVGAQFGKITSPNVIACKLCKHVHPLSLPLILWGVLEGGGGAMSGGIPAWRKEDITYQSAAEVTCSCLGLFPQKLSYVVVVPRWRPCRRPPHVCQLFTR